MPVTWALYTAQNACCLAPLTCEKSVRNVVAHSKIEWTQASGPPHFECEWPPVPPKMQVTLPCCWIHTLLLSYSTPSILAPLYVCRSSIRQRCYSVRSVAWISENPRTWRNTSASAIRRSAVSSVMSVARGSLTMSASHVTCKWLLLHCKYISSSLSFSTCFSALKYDIKLCWNR